MKIVYLSNAPLPWMRANAIQTMRMCEAFASEGADVKLIASLGDAAAADLCHAYGVTQNFDFINVSKRAIPGYSAVLSPQSALLALMQRADSIYTRHLRAGAFAAAAGAPVVYEAHNLPSGLIGKGAWATLKRGRRSGRLVTISQALTDALNWPGETLVAHDGASESAVLDPPRSWPSSGSVRIGYIGSTYPGKGADFVCQLAREMPDLTFELVGGGPAEMRRQVGDLSANLICHGRVTPEEASRCRGEYDILLAPYSARVASAGGSDISSWMSPLKMFEYMAAGRPIVCSNIPVLREVLENGKNAVLCQPDNVSEWVSAIRRLLDSPAMAMQLANNARQKFLDSFTWRARARQIMEFIDRD